MDLEEGHVISSTDSFDFVPNPCGIQIIQDSDPDREIFISWSQVGEFTEYLSKANSEYSTRKISG